MVGSPTFDFSLLGFCFLGAFMYDSELVRSSLIKIQTALDRILQRSETILFPDDFLMTIVK